MPEQLEAAERAKLSVESAEHYEARLFAERNPEYFPCPSNSKAMLDYLENHKLALVYNNFVKAYTSLKRHRKIMPAGEAMARMSPEEIQKLAAAIGIPVYDYAGRIVGYNWPHQVTQQTTDNTRLRTGSGVGFKGKEAHEYRRWCEENNFDPDTGEKKK
jgi:hypothetical protein